ncbi:hypothetical protein A256_12856 [Pseudomonas syringae pv. actinidiae ICMP 19103]|nr:hypothetical protein PSYAC_12801 [Pseudomonas syringae pv. actinidiae str. M302091]EPM52962.1 hypothetical protein A256_12856 [Pseudomonas syringae pv. actinidiae ICMP 19103]EPM90592.1 hypothetical protein A260_00295 [Pseudomonas syringae pv. actinidiae ICMP 19068]EPN06978.1 hypothetical protein A253_00441 [Pseudomonas syringae pv. actinidiae ICMP 19102]EPN13173.1 hypothetical protein A252_00588 [Pseudomonas syringae pv. actinidiae ICMP 9855]
MGVRGINRSCNDDRPDSVISGLTVLGVFGSRVDGINGQVRRCNLQQKVPTWLMLCQRDIAVIDPTIPNTLMGQLGMLRWWRAVQDQNAPTALSLPHGMSGCRSQLMHQPR